MSFNIPVTLQRTLTALRRDPSRLGRAWEAWNNWGGGTRPSVDRDGFVTSYYRTDYRLSIDRFNAAVAEYSGLVCDTCADCSILTVELVEVHDARKVCQRCSNNYLDCPQCGRGRTGQLYRVRDLEHDICGYCISSNYQHCSICECYVPASEDHGHPGGCGCEAPHTHFSFPADGFGTIQENQRLTIELGSGVIDEEGIASIKAIVANELFYKTGQLSYGTILEAVDSVGVDWQTKRGNYTKRLSSALHKHKVKLPPEVLSQVGNVATDHSSGESSWHIEITRDLNAPAHEFCHPESCWWTSYHRSRCVLKNWGGLGLRSYSGTRRRRGNPQGRAWIQPLNEALEPTHDALNAHAYLVFNGYEALSGYTAARIVAHLTGRTYHKIILTIANSYVNNEAGYLVADAATCKATKRISLGNNTLGGTHDRHFQFDAATIGIDLTEETEHDLVLQR